MELFYKEIEQKRNQKEKMILQVDLEFEQNEIKKLNQKYNVEMFSTKIRGGKAFAVEQKIREFKKKYLGVNVCINRQKPADSMQKNLLVMLFRI